MKYNYEDILLNEENDINIVGGDFAIGSSLLQEVAIITKLKSGELKSDPLLAPNLIQLINSKAKQVDIEQRLRIHLARDGKDFEEIKKYISVNGINI
jgi:hypothetical protein